MTVFKQLLNNLDKYQVDQRHRIAYHTIGLSNSLYESCSQRQQVQDQVVELSCGGLIVQRTFFVRLLFI